MIRIENVSKYYRRKKALSHVSLELPRGQIVGLFGENGAGKSTLMKAILGLLSFQGKITLDGQPVGQGNVMKLSFATSEHSFFPGLTPEGHRDFYREHFPSFSEKRFRSLMNFFQLPYHRPLRSFSTGQKNQFEVIMALSQGADYILMDEPFAGNDVFNREDFYKVMAGILEPHETVLLSTHLIGEVEHFIDRALLLHQGELVGDLRTTDLEDAGKGLLDCIRETYQYRSDRVVQILEDITEE